VSLWFCKKNSSALSQGGVNFREESHGFIDFMNHGEQQGDVDLVVKVRDSERVRTAQSCLDPIEYVCAACPSHQGIQHLRLKVHAGHATVFANESCQG
jgi:hypothetical protein